MPALYAIRPLDRKPPKPGSSIFTSPKLRQVLTEPVVHLVPAVHGLLLTVRGHVVIEKSVPRAVVAMEHVRFAERLQPLLVLIDLGGAWPHIVVAEQTNDRCVQISRQLDYGNGA